MTLQVVSRGPQRRATLKTRQNVSRLGGNELAAFRSVIAAVLDRPDNRGYQYFAGWHGVPDGICQHHNNLFLPWHRGYLYHFELALQDVDPTVTLPWWNWLEERGIPPAFDDPEVDGQPNVLASAPVTPVGVPAQDWFPTKTHRAPWDPDLPGPGPQAPPLREFDLGDQRVDTLKWLMSATTHSDFSQRCWRVHDNIHVWVGGEMGDANWAAFDPLFWAHHTMVDRLWRMWQYEHQGADPAPAIIDQPMTFLKPPSFTVREVLDVTQLGYEYSGQTSRSVPGPT